MNNILIIKIEENFDYASLASSLKLISENNTNIYILTSNIHAKFLGYFNCIKKINIINLSIIKSIANNKMYSRSVAINHINDQLVELEKINWHTIINLDNSKESSYLAGTFVKDDSFVIGNYYGLDNKMHYNNKWSRQLRINNTIGTNQGISSTDVIERHFYKKNLTPSAAIKINEKLSAKANDNFNYIINAHTKKNISKVYGISLLSFDSATTLSNEYLLQILNFLYRQPEILPVLISSGEENQKRIANYLNEKLDNKIITITCSKHAVAPILLRLNLLISAPSEHIALADALNLKSILLRDTYLDDNSFYTTTDGSIEIQYTETSEAIAETCYLIDQINNSHNINEVKSRGINSLLNSHDTYGLLKLPASNNFNPNYLLRYYINRTLQCFMFGQPCNKELIEHISKNTDKDTLNEVMLTMQTEIKKSLTTTLSCLRSIKTYKSNNLSKKVFIKCLDDLIILASEARILSTPLLKFEISLEELSTNSLDNNLRAIENLLFDLKSNLSQAITILTLMGHNTDSLNSNQMVQNE